MKHMVTLDYKLMLSLSLWQYNHHPDEGLTSGLFQKTFGPVDGKHYYEKWTGYFNRNLWDMIAYFRGEGENGQKFCDMIAAQVELYTKNRRRSGAVAYSRIDRKIFYKREDIRKFIERELQKQGKA